MCSRAEIDRYLLDGLPPGREGRLRAHLGVCERCRGQYDELVRLLRGLQGAPQGPTAEEQARLERLVLGRAGLGAQPASAGRGSWRDGLVWASGLRLAGLAAAGLVLVLALVWWLAPAGPPELEVGAPGQSLEGTRELHLARGGLLKLLPGTRARLIDEERLELEQGVVWCQVDPGRGGFSVRTPLAEVRVVGTSFVVEERAGRSTEVRVFEGQVELSARLAGGSVRLRAGERSAVLPGRTPPEVRPFDPRAEPIDWERLQRRGEQALERAGREADKTFHRVERELRDRLPR
ncbi:MAG TPA: FecR family protein [Myxococcota bacterium]|nr:FecR family protein [Myxococcota bacterium]HRY96569.1 FecR family protein [Myxococcota bacterium]